MDKKIIDTLINEGLITTFVDESKYKSIDDLINKGVITIPGAKSKIMELLEKCGMETIEISNDETIINPETVVEIKEDEIVEVTEVDETKAPVEEIVDTVEVVEETLTEETTTEEAPVEEFVEIPEETPKKKKSTKKAEHAE